MLTKMQKVAFWAGLFGAAKLVMQLYGLEIPDETWNNLANGAAGLATFVGIVLDHGKSAE
jgi:uncharacterized membrane protein